MAGKKQAAAASKVKIQYYRSAIGFTEKQKLIVKGLGFTKRGFTNARFKKEFSIVNVSDLVKFDKGSKIGPQELLAAGLIRKLEKNGVRILGDGQLDRALHISAHYFTESARQKITSAGGTCEVIRL